MRRTFQSTRVKARQAAFTRGSHLGRPWRRGISIGLLGAIAVGSAAIGAGCGSARRPLLWRATGERVRQVMTEVPDVQSHQVEVSEFALRAADQRGVGDAAVVFRIVLVADYGPRERTVFGYAEQRSPAGARHLYRVHGQARRSTVSEQTATIFDRVALYAETDGPRGSGRARDFASHMAFRMTVDDQTGQARVSPQYPPLPPSTSW